MKDENIEHDEQLAGKGDELRLRLVAPLVEEEEEEEEEGNHSCAGCLVRESKECRGAEVLEAGWCFSRGADPGVVHSLGKRRKAKLDHRRNLVEKLELLENTRIAELTMLTTLSW